MEKEFVPYEQALALKALGFNEKCIMHWWKGKLSYYQMGDFSPTHTSAPTFSQAFRWFREKGYDVKIIKESPGLYFGFYWNGAAWIMVGNGTYEASELACLDKLIEIIEQKNKK